MKASPPSNTYFYRLKLFNMQIEFNCNWKLILKAMDENVRKHSITLQKHHFKTWNNSCSFRKKCVSNQLVVAPKNFWYLPNLEKRSVFINRTIYLKHVLQQTQLVYFTFIDCEDFSELYQNTLQFCHTN